MNSPAYVLREKERRRDRFRAGLVILSIALLLALGILFFARNRSFRTYSFKALGEIPTSQNTRIVPFADGHLLVGMDSVTYVRNDSVVYTRQIVMSHPVVASEGDYFVISDRGGYQIQIFDTGGFLSAVKLSRKIRATDIAATGIVAVFTESNDAAYISYFDRFGAKVSVEIRAYLDSSGYPMDIAISPDGQKLLVPYYSTANGIGESRLVLYDFERGKEDDSYIVATVDDFYDSGTFLLDCDFIDDSRMVAVGDKSFSFFTYRSGKLSEPMTVTPEDPVRSLFFAGSYVGIVTERDGTASCSLYAPNGKCYSDFGVPAGYTAVTANGRYVLFTEGSRITLYNLSGKFRYEGTLTLRPVSVAFLPGPGILVSEGTGVFKIAFQ